MSNEIRPPPPKPQPEAPPAPRVRVFTEADRTVVSVADPRPPPASPSRVVIVAESTRVVIRPETSRVVVRPERPRDAHTESPHVEAHPEVPPRSPSAGRGIRGVVALALAAYRAWRAELERAGLTRAGADARILEEAKARGGVLLPGESINLSLWCDRDESREVLEALAIAYHRASPEWLCEARVLEAETTLEPMPDAAMTPAPHAMRIPPWGPAAERAGASAAQHSEPRAAEGAPRWTPEED